MASAEESKTTPGLKGGILKGLRSYLERLMDPSERTRVNEGGLQPAVGRDIQIVLGKDQPQAPYHEVPFCQASEMGFKGVRLVTSRKRSLL